MLRFKINHSPRPKEKNNTLGYPIMKKEKKKKKRKKKEEKDKRKAQRIRIQRPMKRKGLKNTQRKKGRPGRPESVSQRKRSRGKSGWDPRKCQSPNAQHSPNKIPTVEEKNWVSSAQSCSEGSESIEQTFMDKGAVSQGTKDEKNKKVEAARRELST